MRRFKLLLICSLLVSVYSYSISANYMKTQKVIITGQVKNKDKSINQVNIALHRVGLSDLNQSVLLDSLGYFYATFKSYIPTDVQIEYKSDFLIIAHPGDSIHLSFDGKAEKKPDLLKTIRFNGNDVISNQKIVQIQKVFYSSSLYNNKVLNLKETSGLNSSFDLDSLRFACDNLYWQVINEINPNTEVSQWAKTFIYAYYINKIPDSEDLLLNYIPKSVPELICGSKINILVDKFINYINIKSKEDPENKAYTGELVVGELMQVMERFELDFVNRPIKYIPSGLFQQVVFCKSLEKELHFENIHIFDKYKAKIDSILIQPFLYYPLMREYNKLLKELTYPDKIKERNFQNNKMQIIMHKWFRKLYIKENY